MWVIHIIEHQKPRIHRQIGVFTGHYGPRVAAEPWGGLKQDRLMLLSQLIGCPHS